MPYFNPYLSPKAVPKTCLCPHLMVEMISGVQQRVCLYLLCACMDYISCTDFYSPDNYMKVRRTVGHPPLRHHRTWLLSPQENIIKPSCLSFRYLLSYVDYNIYTYTSDGLTLVLRIMHDGQDGAWHTTYANIPSGRYGLAFEMTFGSTSVEDNGIDNVNITEGSCWKEGIYHCILLKYTLLTHIISPGVNITINGYT